MDVQAFKAQRDICVQCLGCAFICMRRPNLKLSVLFIFFHFTQFYSGFLIYWYSTSIKYTTNIYFAYPRKTQIWKYHSRRLPHKNQCFGLWKNCTNIICRYAKVNDFSKILGAWLKNYGLPCPLKFRPVNQLILGLETCPSGFRLFRWILKNDI